MGDSRDEIRRRHGRDVADDLYIVPRSEIYDVKSLDEREMRVANYARVSTYADEQVTSLVLQEQHFRDMIKREYVARVERPGARRLNRCSAKTEQAQRGGCTLTTG